MAEQLRQFIIAQLDTIDRALCEAVFIGREPILKAVGWCVVHQATNQDTARESNQTASGNDLWDIITKAATVSQLLESMGALTESVRQLLLPP